MCLHGTAEGEDSQGCAVYYLAFSKLSDADTATFRKNK